MSFEKLTDTMSRHARVLWFGRYDSNQNLGLTLGVLRSIAPSEIQNVAYIEADFNARRFPKNRSIDPNIESRVCRIVNGENVYDQITVSGLQKVTETRMRTVASQPSTRSHTSRQSRFARQAANFTHITRNLEPYLDTRGNQYTAISHTAVFPRSDIVNARRWTGKYGNDFNLTYAVPSTLGDVLIAKWLEQPAVARDVSLAVLTRFAAIPVAQSVLAVGWEEANAHISPLTIFDARELTDQQLYELTMPAGYMCPTV